MLPTNKCSKCGELATHKFVRIVNGEVRDLYLCQQHAAETSPYQKQPNLSEILEGLLKQDLTLKSASGSAPVPSGIRCKSCGLSFESYRKNLMLGCSECYAAFREYLAHDLRKFHGKTRHVGRQPGGGKVILPAEEAARPLSPAEKQGEPSEAAASSISQQRIHKMLDELDRKLKAAIHAEDFDKAAQYRDLIKEMRQKGKPAPTPAPQANAQPTAQP